MTKEKYATFHSKLKKKHLLWTKMILKIDLQYILIAKIFSVFKMLVMFRLVNGDIR